MGPEKVVRYQSGSLYHGSLMLLRDSSPILYLFLTHSVQILTAGKVVCFISLFVYLLVLYDMLIALLQIRLHF